jgi:chorismate mutase
MTASLQTLRTRIDAVDMQILELLRQRALVVEEVRGAKGKLPIYIRPGREAHMLRALVNENQGHIPKGLVHRLWREIIGGFTLIEGALNVAVAVPQGEEGLWDFARDHFGSFTPMQSFNSATHAFRAVAAATHQVACLPSPRESDEDVWWRLLLGAEKDANQPNIFYRIPFDGVKGNARKADHDAVVVARLQPEQTAQDRTVLIIEWNDAQLIGAALADFPHTILTHMCAGTPPCSWLEYADFNMEDAVLDAWRQKHKAAIVRNRIAGAYPVPMSDIR